MNIQAMMKQAQALQKDMLKVKEEVDNTEFVGESSLVKVTVKGTKEVVKVEIDAQDGLDADDVQKDTPGPDARLNQRKHGAPLPQEL